MRKADLQSASSAQPDHITVDETVIQVNDQRYWLFAAVAPETNRFLHVRLFPTRTVAITKLFLRDLTEKHDVSDAVFFIDGAPWLKAALYEFGLQFQHPREDRRSVPSKLMQTMGMFTV